MKPNPYEPFIVLICVIVIVFLISHKIVPILDGNWF